MDGVLQRSADWCATAESRVRANWSNELTVLKIQFIKLDFSKLIFQKSSTDQQGVSVSQFENTGFETFL